MRGTRRFDRLFRHAWHVAVAALAVVALAGCSALGGSDSNSSGGNDKVEKAHVNVAVIPGVIDIAGYKRAVEAGYFKDEGLEPEDVSVSTGAVAPPMLLNHEIDFAFGNWTSFLEAQAKGVLGSVGGLRVVSDAQQAREGMTALVVLPDSPIKSIKDLTHRSIGVNALKSNVTLTSQAVLRANGVDDTSVQFKVVSTASALNAMRTHQVDAMSLQEPNLTIAKRELGAVVIADRAAGPVANFPISGYVTSGDFAKQNPRTVAAFQRAMARGQADVANRQVLESILQRYAKIDNGVAQAVVAGTFPTSVDKARLQQLATLMQTYGILDRALDVSPMFPPGA
jgi:NitT/TauT family transport system substrate-binding protein